MALFSLCLPGADKKQDETTPANYNIPLWEAGKVPLADGTGPLDNPFLTVFQPPAGKRNGSSVIIAPGGSNIMLMYGAEGVDIAERYNEWGVTAFVLTYRLSPKYRADARLLDGKRAVQLVRSRAAEWKLDPTKIGFAGFSAGSEAVRAVVADTAEHNPNAADPLERVSARPDYIVLVYSAGRATKDEQFKNYPPSFLLSAAADRGPANALAQLFIELNRAGAVSELHIYQKGRHGFGAAFASPAFSPWMDALRHFLIQGGFIPEAK
ncbi:MAG TPA: alpha/beta hydrolase [Bryobacteraceae bacterium]|nr:alpha/beta hydrolase [Bryobacteraceae bacterium]